MLNHSTKRKIKANTYKAVRENIQLNNVSRFKSDLPVNISDENNWIYQLAENNLIGNLHGQALSKKGKLIVKWWEN